MRLLILIGRALFVLALARQLAATIYKHKIKGWWKWKTTNPIGATNRTPQLVTKSRSKAGE